MKTALDYVYLTMGLFIIYVAYENYRDIANAKRFTSAVFWLVLGIVLAFGGMLPPLLVGLLVAVLAGISAINGVVPGSAKEAPYTYRQQQADKLKAKPLWAVLVIPAVTFAFTPIKTIFQAPLVGLGFSSVLGGIVAMVLTKDNFGSMMVEGRRITDAVSWPLILPPYLAALGAVFNAAGVGPVVADLVSTVLPVGSKFGAIVAYALGMALFTVIMGTAKAIVAAPFNAPSTEITASVKPKSMAPASPMNMVAGLKLYGKNPKALPASATASAEAKTCPRDEATAKRAKAPIIDTPAAKPSRPSRKLTTFTIPTIQRMVRGMPQKPR
jgi:uncharacterized membrane protein